MSIIELIEEEKRAQKALEEARKKAGGILEDAKRKAADILEKAQKEAFFQDFNDKRILEIEKRRKAILRQFEDERNEIAKRVEKNLGQVVDYILENVLGV